MAKSLELIKLQESLNKVNLDIPEFPKLKELSSKESEELDKNPNFKRHSEYYEKHKSFLDGIVKKIREISQNILKPDPWSGSYIGSSSCAYDDHRYYSGYVRVSDSEANFSIAFTFSFAGDDYDKIIFNMKVGGFNFSNAINFCTYLLRKNIDNKLKSLVEKTKDLINTRTKSRSSKSFVIDTDDWREKNLGEPEDVAKKIESKLGKCSIRYEYDIMRIMLPNNTKSFEDTLYILKKLLNVDVRSVTITKYNIK